MPRKTASARRDLGIYRRIYMRMWLDEKFRGLSSPTPSAQFLWLYLLTGPATVAAPGVIRATRGGLSDELRWSPDDLQGCFDELQATGMVEVDWSAGVIWLPKAAIYNPPASPNAVKAWAKSLDHITECPLKVRIVTVFMEFLEQYGEQFQEPFQGQFREPGAGAGTGEPLYPLAHGTVPGTLPHDQPDPAPQDGAGGSSRSTEDGDPEKGTKEVVSEEEFRLDGGSDISTPSESDGPVIPSGGSREPGCTQCGKKVMGVLFRQAASGEQFPHLALACHCWGCASLKCRNTYKLPVPSQKNRHDWKRFEQAFPAHKRMRKRDRDRFTSEAVARTHRIFEGVAVASERRLQEAEDAKARAPDCGHCESPAGLMFRDTALGWEVGLCPACGGSALHANPPEFMGPPIRAAGKNSGWVPWAKTPGAGLGDGSAESWREAAIARSRAFAKDGTVPVDPKDSIDPGQDVSGVSSEPVPEPSDDWDLDDDISLPADDISLATDEISLAPDGVSGEPPPL